MLLLVLWCSSSSCLLISSRVVRRAASRTAAALVSALILQVLLSWLMLLVMLSNLSKAWRLGLLIDSFSHLRLMVRMWTTLGNCQSLLFLKLRNNSVEIAWLFNLFVPIFYFVDFFNCSSTCLQNQRFNLLFLKKFMMKMLTCFFMIFLSMWWLINSSFPWMFAKTSLEILSLLQSWVI